MGNRLVDDVPRTDGGGAATPLDLASGEALEAQTVVIGPRSKKLPPDSFVPKPDPETETRPATKRRPSTLPPPRSAGNRLPAPTQTPRSMPVAAMPADPPQVIAVRSILAAPRAARSSVTPPVMPTAIPPVTPAVIPPVTPTAISPAAIPPVTPPQAGALPGVAAPPADTALPIASPSVAAAPAQGRPAIEIDEATQVASPPPPPSSIATTHGAFRPTGEPTDVVTPLPFPILVVEGTTRRAAEATELVAPLPPPRAASTPSVVVEPGLVEAETTGNAATDRRRWLVAGAMGAAAVVAVILFVAIGFSSAGVTRDYPPVDRAPPTTPPAVKPMPMPAAAAVKPPPPERAAHAEPPPDPASPTDVAAPMPAPPSPAVAPMTPTDEVSPPADDSGRPSRPRTRIAPPPTSRTSPSATHRPAQVVKPASRLPVKPRPPTYDPDALFLKKP